MNDKEDNGNGKAQLTEQELKPIQEIPEDVLRSLANLMDNNTEERTKYTVLERLTELDRLGFFTEFSDKDEVLRMNKIEMWGELAPLVFGNTPNVVRMINVIKTHTKQHKLNMTSFQRKRELAIVHALRNDEMMVKSTNEAVKKFVGAKRQ